MNKIFLLSLIIFALSSRSYAMEISAQQAQENHFELTSDDSIKTIVDQLDGKSRGCFRLACRRFSTLAWPVGKTFAVAIAKKPDESEPDYWQRVLIELQILSKRIQKMRGNNDITLRLSRTEESLALPDQLSHIKELNGLSMEYYERWDEQRFVIRKSLEKLLMILPNLKMLRLPFGHNSARLPSALYQLKKLEHLYAVGYFVKPEEDFEKIPSSLISVDLCRSLDSQVTGEMIMLGKNVFPFIAKLTSLRSLGLSENPPLADANWEDLAPLAKSLERLDISGIQLTDIPACFTSFENLQEIDISDNNFCPAALHYLTKLTNLRRINLGGNSECEAQKELVRSMFPPSVTIEYKAHPYNG